MIYIVRLNNKEYEVEVEKGQANITKTTEVQPIAPSAPANVPAPISTPASPAPSVAGAGEVINSPMPGTIVDIKASIGAKVKKGDIVLVLEAMKMENEITAPKDGVVTQIFVTRGASVATYDALLSIQ